MAKLRIYFADLIAFVKNPDGSCWVLLPEAQTPSTATDGSRIEAHHPVVLFDRPARPDSDWPEIHRLLHLEDPISSHEAWLLRRQELRIRIPPTGVQTPGMSSVGLPTQNDKTHFTWVPDLAAMGIDAKVHADCLVPNPPAQVGDPPPSTKLVSRLLLESGTLSTFQFVRAKENHILPAAVRIPKLDFRPLRGGRPVSPERACADVAVIDIPLDTPEVVIEAIGMDNGGEVVRSITLTPPPDSGDVINVFVGNLSPDPEMPPPPAGVHFELYYELLPDRADRPVPQLVTGFSADSTTHMAPAGINGDFPLFIIIALQVDFSGLNPPICSVVKLQG